MRIQSSDEPTDAEIAASTLRAVLDDARRALTRAAIIEACLALATSIAILAVVAATGVRFGVSDGIVRVLGAAAFAVSLALVLWRGKIVGRFSRRSHRAIASWLDRAMRSLHDPVPDEIDLVSAVELDRDRGRYGESEALATSGIRSAVERLRARDPGRVVRLEARASIGRAMFLFVMAAVMCLGWAIFGAQHLDAAWSILSRLDTTRDSDGPRPSEPRLGDIRVTYRYPAYSERPDWVSSDTSGAIRALPGTEVTITTTAMDEISSGSVLVSHGADADVLEHALRTDGRRLEARLVLSRSGHYRFRLVGSDGEAFEERRGRDIALEVDAPPTVDLREPTESLLEVNESDRIALAFTASDDFGLSDVFVAWRSLGSPKEGRVRLMGATTGEKRMAETARFDLAPLALVPGDRIAYTLEVGDNDSVNGPKFGASRTMELRIYSKSVHHARVLELEQKAIDELVHILADNVETTVTASPDAETYGKFLDASDAIVARALGADALFTETVAAIRKDPLGRPRVADAFDRARRELGSDARRDRRTLSDARLALERSKKIDATRLRALRAARDATVTSLEKNVVYLADLSNDQRMIDAEALGRELRDQQAALRRAIEEYRNAPSEEARRDVARAMEGIRARIAEIVRELSQLEGTIPRDFVNSDAMRAESAEANAARVEQLMEEGKLEEAMETLERMAKETENMIAELRSGRREIEDREYSEASKMAEDIWRDLLDVERRQGELARKTEAISKQVVERMMARLDRVDDFIRRQTRRLDQASRNVEKAHAITADSSDVDAHELALERVRDTRRALEARDFGAALEMIEQALRHVDQLQRDVQRRSEYARRFGDVMGPGSQHGNAAHELEQAHPILEEVARDIEELIPSPDAMTTERERHALERQRDEQRALRERTKKLQNRMTELGRELPIVGPEVGQLLEDASSSMSSAEQRLGGGDAPSALNDERRAESSLRQLEAELEKLGSRGSSGEGGVPLPFGEPELEESAGGSREGANPHAFERVEIPKPSQHQAPAEFRKDILEAAKQGTVESYRDAVQRYYQELVK